MLADACVFSNLIVTVSRPLFSFHNIYRYDVDSKSADLSKHVSRERERERESLGEREREIVLTC